MNNSTSFKSTHSALIKAIRDLDSCISLEDKFKWKIPEGCPISIPETCKTQFQENWHLKTNMRKVLSNTKDLTPHYWLIRNWGKIPRFGTGKISRDPAIIDIVRRCEEGGTIELDFDGIASLSKIAAFLVPDKYAIYDSRAVYALNWLLVRHLPKEKRFRQPLGRSTLFRDYNTETLYELSETKNEIRAWRNSYGSYCELLIKLSEAALNKTNPYYLEMLLFTAAKVSIPSELKKHVTVTFSNTNNEA